MEPYLNFKYQNIVADAGYESEENYLFLEKNGQTAFIKTTNYEKAKTRKYKNDIGIPENMDYDPEEDVYTCHNGQKLKVKVVRHQKSKTGHVSEKTVYSCEDCSGCPYRRNVSGETTAKPRWKTGRKTSRYRKYLKKSGNRIWSGSPVKRDVS